MPGPIVFLIIAGFVALVGTIITLAIVHERRQRKALLGSLEQAGVELLHGPGHKDPAAAADAFTRMGVLQKLSRGAKNVNYAGRVIVNDRDVTIVQHSFVVSTGKSTHTVYHTMGAVAAPPGWPELRLKPENFLHKLADFVGLKDIRVESAAFNQVWRVTGRDEEFATVLLTPEIQTRLTAWPKGYWVAIGQGAIVVVINTQLKPETLTTLMRLVTELADLIPAEMEMWSAQDSRPPDSRPRA